MARTYSQLDLDQRRTLFRLVEARRPVGEIAARLGRHRSTIYRELGRNRFRDGDRGSALLPAHRPGPGAAPAAGGGAASWPLTTPCGARPTRGWRSSRSPPEIAGVPHAAETAGPRSATDDLTPTAKSAETEAPVLAHRALVPAGRTTPKESPPAGAVRARCLTLRTTQPDQPTSAGS
jgi:hypothetical protein